MVYTFSFLQAFVFTEVIEVTILFFLVRSVLKIEPNKLSNFKIIFVGFIASFATIPYLWFVLPWFINLRSYILLAELGITLFEALIISQFLEIRFKNSLWISFACNSMSFLLGRLMGKLFF